MTHILAVGRRDFDDAVRQLKRLVKPSTSADAALTYDGTLLNIELPGASVAIVAAGEWPERVLVSGRFLLGVGSGMSKEGALTLAVSDGRFKVGGMSVPCAIAPVAEESIRLPVNASLGEVVHVTLEHSADQITSAGLSRTVAAALGRRDRLVARAADVLRPLDITGDEIRAAIDQALRKRYGKP